MLLKPLLAARHGQALAGYVNELIHSLQKLLKAVQSRRRHVDASSHSPVVIEDEEVHSEEAASAANKAQLPTGDTTEDEDRLNEDEDVEEAVR